MEEDREDILAGNMTKGLISFQKFLKIFKQVIKDDIIEKNNNRFDISYNFRKFELECYIIDKKYYDEFCRAINYKEISQVLSVINEETTEKCKEMIKNKLIEENFNIDVKDIVFYTNQEDLKKIVGHFNNYSFLNKELLVDCMGVPEEKLKSKKIFVSKNEKNTTLLNNEDNFTMSINITKKDLDKEEEKKEEEKNLEIKKEEEKKLEIQKKPKNIYYVADITKKIFILLYKKDELIDNKIIKKAKDSYKFKSYYLINKEWLKLYKENFLYDKIISKIDEEFKEYSYRRIKTELNNIVKDKIGQIKLYGNSEIEPGLREASKLLANIKTIKENKDNNDEVEGFDMEIETQEVEQYLAQSYDIPYEFEIINEDIYELLKKEEFLENFTDKIENQLRYQILFGNKKIIIKNKGSEKFEEKDEYSNELLFYEKNEGSENNNDDYILEFILNFEKKVNFYEEINKIFKNGLAEYIINTKINLEENYTEEKILDDNKNVLGKIFNVNINSNKINNEINNNNMENKDDNELQNINEINEEYNFNQNEIILNNDEQNNNNINNKEEKDYSIKDIKKEIQNISKLLNNIKSRIYNNIKNQTQPNINGLDPDELEKILNKSSEAYETSKIILMNEDKYKTFNEKYYLDDLKNILITYQNNKNERKNIIETNREKFTKFLNKTKNQKFIEENIFKLNEDYESCINNINEDKKFVLLSAKSFYLPKENDNNLINFFIYKDVPYIFFRKEKKILKVKIEDKNSEFCNLEIYRVKDNNKIDEYLKSLKIIMQDFKNKKYDEIKEPINEYYLINNKWIDFAENSLLENEENIINKESLSPKYSINDFGHRYPTSFFIVSKNDKNKLMMDNLINYFGINQEDIVINKIYLEKHNYICLLINSTAYFFTYLKIKEKQKEKEIQDLSFFITFINEKIMEEEITKKISLIGVESYINLMFLSNEEPYKIYDMNFNRIGCFINTNSESLIINEEYSHMVNNTDEAIKIRLFLTCLSNIKELADYIPEKNDEIIKDDNNNKIDINFLLNFFAVLRIIKKWNTEFFVKIKQNNIICQKYDEVYGIFLTQIQDLSTNENENIVKNLNILIKKVILELQKQLYQLNTKKKFDYDEERPFKKNLIQINQGKTIFQKLFFFELEITKKNCTCRNKVYELKYYLEFNLNENDKDQTKISSLFEKMSKDEVCNLCKKKINIKKKLVSLPEYLIIVVNVSKKYISTSLEEKININKFCYIQNKNAEYELISFSDVNFRPIIKSNNIWNGYNTEKFNINKERKMPNLLIYKQIKQK